MEDRRYSVFLVHGARHVSARTTLPAAQLRPSFFHIQDRHRCTGLRVYLIYRPSCADTVVNPARPYRVALPLDVAPSPIVIIIAPIASQSCTFSYVLLIPSLTSKADKCTSILEAAMNRWKECHAPQLSGEAEQFARITNLRVGCRLPLLQWPDTCLRSRALSIGRNSSTAARRSSLVKISLTTG